MTTNLLSRATGHFNYIQWEQSTFENNLSWWYIWKQKCGRLSILITLQTYIITHNHFKDIKKKKVSPNRRLFIL